ncbi:MAG: helix-turn-helix transcriptional regulator [Solirubrobacterales bacterium]|nr:helix-turn-helix transcriptional regulator [Solirubrobacterales bacterium]
MSAVKPKDPRANQKARTRAAIIAAAKELQRQGTAPTVEQAAEHARVSRATAYRYFPTKEALLIELSAMTDPAPVEALLANLTTEPVEERLRLLIDTFDGFALAEEEHVRAFTRVSLDTWLRSRRNGEEAPVVREGRRMRWLETVLAPLDDLPPERKRRLQAALALTLGGEAIITMKDVCRLDNDEALAVLRWAATALLRAAVHEGPGSAADDSERPTGNGQPRRRTQRPRRPRRAPADSNATKP